MVSFQCENCGDIFTKKKLDAHYYRCPNTSFTCLDCMTQFYGQDYKSHTSCISEAQKYQGALYKEKKPKPQGKGQASTKVPKPAYVEDVPDSPNPSFRATTTIDVPPPAPSPPGAGAPPHDHEPVNVFDFLVPESPASSVSSAPTSYKSSKERTNGGLPTETPMARGSSSRDEPQYTYGEGPIEPSTSRYDSDLDLSMPDVRDPPPRTGNSHTPAARHTQAEAQSQSQSDKKRKRGQTDEQDPDLSAETYRPNADLTARAPLHSGLTGGLTKLLSTYDVAAQVQASPLSPKKRSKRTRDEEGPRRPPEEERAQRLHKDHDEQERRLVLKKRTDGRDSGKEDGSSGTRVRRSERHTLEGRKDLKTIEYPGASGQGGGGGGELIKRGPRALKQLPEQSHSEFFLGLVDKGHGSIKGQSIWGALKMFHEGLQKGGEEGLESEDKRLFKGLRMKLNRHGEVVLFARPESELDG